jgi:lysophospholipase L1-like esterase
VAAVRALAAACLVVSLAGSGCTSDEARPEAATPTTPAATTSEDSTTREAPTYVAMGDSYTSAPGVGETADAGCFRSSSNYPSLVAADLGLALTDVSCGGATTTSLVGVQETPSGAVPPQFAALTPETDVVTLSIGGNDEDLFPELLGTCLAVRGQDPDGAPCRDTFEADGTDRAMEIVELVQHRVASALTGIRDRAPGARVVLVGYPQLAPADGQCEQLPLTPDDYGYVRDLLSALGAATEAAAAEAKVDYVDVLAASEGHDICAGADAWVNGVGGTSSGAMAMHPFAAEQRAVADLVVEALSR